MILTGLSSTPLFIMIGSGFGKHVCSKTLPGPANRSGAAVSKEKHLYTSPRTEFVFENVHKLTVALSASSLPFVLACQFLAMCSA